MIHQLELNRNRIHRLPLVLGHEMTIPLGRPLDQMNHPRLDLPPGLPLRYRGVGAPGGQTARGDLRVFFPSVGRGAVNTVSFAAGPFCQDKATTQAVGTGNRPLELPGTPALALFTQYVRMQNVPFGIGALVTHCATGAGIHFHLGNFVVAHGLRAVDLLTTRG